MHEFSLLADLIKKINQILAAEKADRVLRVSVKIGALAHISGEHFQEHFEHAVCGTPLAGAVLMIEESADEMDPDAQSIVLKSVEVADD